MAQLGIAIFGLGRAGGIHFNNLICNPSVVIKYIVDADCENASKKVQTYRTNIVVLPPEDVDRVYTDAGVDGIVICTPTYTREGYVLNGLKHGKGVFCEKPIAENQERTWNCYEAARKADKPLICGFNRRFDPALLAIRERVKAGEVGAVHTIHTISRDYLPPSVDYVRDSGGMFHDCAIHDIDLICWILGEYPNSVFTEATVHDEAIRGAGDVDTVAIVMRFPSNILSTINLSRHASYGYDQRIEVFGRDGMIRKENQPSYQIEISNRNGMTRDQYNWSFVQRYRQSYVDCINHYIQVLRGEAKSCVIGNQTLAASLVASALTESYRSEKKVTLDLTSFQQPELVSSETVKLVCQTWDMGVCENGREDE